MPSNELLKCSHNGVWCWTLGTTLVFLDFSCEHHIPNLGFSKLSAMCRKIWAIPLHPTSYKESHTQIRILVENSIGPQNMTLVRGETSSLAVWSCQSLIRAGARGRGARRSGACWVWGRAWRAPGLRGRGQLLQVAYAPNICCLISQLSRGETGVGCLGLKRDTFHKQTAK